MGDEPDLDPEISRSFFEGNVLKLDPSLLTENGIRLVINKKMLNIAVRGGHLYYKFRNFRFIILK